MVEVPGGQHPPEKVTALHGPTDLGEELAAGAGQPTGRAVQHVDPPSANCVADLLQVDPNRQIGEAVVVEVASRQGNAKVVAALGGVGDPGAVLGPHLAAGAGQPGGRPV
jgi:hypothetical protein